MILRRLPVLCAFVLLSGTAQAQFQPPAPYAYPQNGQGIAPLPNDDSVAFDDDDDDLAPVPGARQLPPPQGRLSRQGAPSGYDPRFDPDADAYRPDPGIAPADPQGAPFGHYGDPARAPGATEASRPPANVGPGDSRASTPPAKVASLPDDDQPEIGEPKELPPQFKRQVVDYVTKQPVGSIIIDTPATYLYLVLGDGKAMRYGIGVGRDGFTWSGTEKITRLAEWPDWHPPAEMIERQPYLPRFMAGGPGNPLGARALYLGKTVYRIHGTNQPSTIGKFVSSGCIRLLNEDIEDLYGRVKVGTRVTVRPGVGAAAASASAAPAAR